MVIRFFDSCRRSICLLRFQSPTVKDTKKGTQKWHERTKQLIRQLLLPVVKSLQPCLTLCNPIDGSPPGFPVPGILQARALEWIAISFSNA